MLKPSHRTASTVRSGPSPRLLLLMVLLASSLAALVRAEQPAPLAELSVTAFGAQRLDLATGFTELVDGGIVVDQGSGVRLEAPWLRYAEGERLDAQDALVEGAFGSLTAARVRLDLLARRLEAEGGVTLRAEGTEVRADALRYDTQDGWLRAIGEVVGDEPAFEAAALWYDTIDGRIVLVPPYAYQDGPLALRAEAGGAPLQLTPERDEAGVLLGFDASTSLDDDVRAALAAASWE